MHVDLLLGEEPVVVTDPSAEGSMGAAGLWVPMVLVNPDVVDRTTGTVRHVAAFVDLPQEVMARLLTVSRAPVEDARPVTALLVHRVSRRALAAGPFDDLSAARTWWNSPRNRLAGNPAMVIRVLPLVDSSSGPLRS